MATYKDVRIKKPGGGYRTQRAMVLASGKLKFVPNAKKGGSKKHNAPRPHEGGHMAKSKSKSKSMTHKRRRSYHPARKHPRRRRHGGGHNLMHIGLAAAGLAYAANNVPTVTALANKIPGAKTFGPEAAIGIAALGVDRFLYRNKWLRLAGIAGVVVAAAKAGKAGSSFQWVGDADVDEDIGDADDDVGDDGLDY